jgi:NlpC/P60 family
VARKTGTQFATLALGYLGTPYLWGGSSPSGFDCSGLVQYALGRLGVAAPRTSENQYAWAKPVSTSRLKPGDLVFLNFPGEQSPGHVMIWLGSDLVLQAPQQGQNVQVSHFDPKQPGANEWGATVVGYGRVPGLSYANEPDTLVSSGGGGTSAVSILKHLADLSPAGLAAQESVSAVQDARGVVKGTESVGSFLGKLTDPSFLLRGVEVIGGVVLALLGLLLLARASGLGAPSSPVLGGAAAELEEAAA